MTSPQDASRRWQEAVRAVGPAGPIITCLEITHPDVPGPVRAANDTQARVVGGETYHPLRFEPRFADSVEGRVPQAEIRMDNVGQILTQWIDLSGGGSGAQCRVFQVAVSLGEPAGEDAVEWEMTFDVIGIRYDQESVIATLGFNPVLVRPAVQIRHDPATSPGLF